jgi:hypothetical protein
MLADQVPPRCARVLVVFDANTKSGKASARHLVRSLVAAGALGCCWNAAAVLYGGLLILGTDKNSPF